MTQPRGIRNAKRTMISGLFKDFVAAVLGPRVATRDKVGMASIVRVGDGVTIDDATSVDTTVEISHDAVEAG
jgi:hypothetical protein